MPASHAPGDCCNKRLPSALAHSICPCDCPCVCMDVLPRLRHCTDRDWQPRPDFCIYLRLSACKPGGFSRTGKTRQYSVHPACKPGGFSRFFFQTYFPQKRGGLPGACAFTQSAGCGRLALFFKNCLRPCAAVNSAPFFPGGLFSCPAQGPSQVAFAAHPFE